MAQQSAPVLDLTFRASGAVAARRCVTFAGAQATVAGSKIAGVARTLAANGEAFAVAVVGTVVVETGAEVAVGDGLAVDSQGRAVPAGAVTVAAGGTAVTSSAANGAILAGGELPQFVFADAMEAAPGAGKMIEVLLRR